MEYPALFEPAQEAGFVITFPDFDWGITQGDSEAQAVEMASDALMMMIQVHIRKEEALPRSSWRPQVPDYTPASLTSHES